MNSIRVSLILAACLGVVGFLSIHAAENTPAPAGPEGVEWRLVALNGKAPAVVAGGRGAPTIQFDGGKKTASGFSGVNRFFGGYEREGEKLKFGALAGTEMAGEPKAMETERAFHSALESATAWRIADGALELLKDGKVVARFSAKPAVAK